MKSDWVSAYLADCGDWLSGGTPSKSQSKYWQGNIPWVSPKDMNNHFINDAQDHISPEGTVNGSRLIPPHTILFVVRSMTLAHTFQIAITKREVAFNQDLKAIICKENIYPYFLYYTLLSKSNEILQLVDEASHGTKRLRTEVLKELRISFPPLPEQQAIAHILGSLDDKIELNRQMNETLEDIARALFKSWFVDFDPVRAKMEGRQPFGMDEETAGLFPDGFEDSRLGEVPKGWQVSSLPEILEINPLRSLRSGLLAPYLEMSNVSNTSARILGWENRNFTSGTKFINGDTLVARITPCLENGKTAFVDFLTGNEVGWGSTEYIILRSKQPLPLEYSYFLARSDDFRTYAIRNMTGTSGRQRVPIGCFNSYFTVKPSQECAKVFGNIAQIMMKAIKQKDEESRTLTTLRDTLLPKLLSGEIRIKQAEKEVEAIL